MIATLILALHLIGFITLESAITSLYAAGALLIAAEFAIISFGVIGLNGVLALIFAYALQTGGASIFGLALSWGLFFGIAAIETIIFGVIIYIYLRNKNAAVTTGLESMIGETATVIEWQGKNGRVHVQGESWKARSDQIIKLKKNDQVIVESTAKLTVTIKPKD